MVMKLFIKLYSPHGRKPRPRDYDKSFIMLEADSLEDAKKKAEFTFNSMGLEYKSSWCVILEGTLENDSNLSPAIKNVLNNPRLKGIHNVIGRLISTEDTYRLAIEMALSSAANFLVVDSSKDAQKAIAFLKENKLGRVTFFPLDVILGRSLPASVLEEAKRCPGFINTANNLVTFDTKYQSIIENQLGQVLVVKDFKALEELGEKTMHRYRIVSLEAGLNDLRRRLPTRPNSEYVMVIGQDHNPYLTPNAEAYLNEISGEKVHSVAGPADFRLDIEKATEENHEVWKKVFDFLGR